MARVRFGEESKVYVSKTLIKTKLRIKKVHFVCRQRESYDKQAVGIWWRPSTGVGVQGKPNRVLKYFMFGISFFNLRLWLDFTWLGKSKTDPKLKIKPDGVYGLDID
jgi:hypothetical protein